MSSRPDALCTLGAGFVALIALGQADEVLAAPSPGGSLQEAGAHEEGRRVDAVLRVARWLAAVGPQ